MNLAPLRLLSVALTLLLASCKPGPTPGSATPSGPTPAQLADFAKRTGLFFPPSTKGLARRHDRGMDDQIFLKVEMPSADLPAFLARSGLDKELRNTTRPGPATSYLGKSLPAHPAKFREGQKSLPSDKFLNVLVDEDSPTTVVIYLQWFET